MSEIIARYRIRTSGPRGILFLIALSLLLGVGSESCSDSERSLERLDLEAFARSTRTTVETSLVDFSEESASSNLLDGWSSDEGAFTWALGHQSSLSIFIGTPGPRTLVAGVSPLQWQGAPPQALAISIDGRPIGVNVLEPGFQELRWEIPTELLSPGMRRIDIRYARADRPDQVLPPSTDSRRLALAWHELRLEGAPPARSPETVERDGRTTLLIPRGTIVDFYAEAESPALLDLALAGADGADLVPVHVRVVGDRSGLLWEETIDVASARRIPLPLEGGDVVRVRLDATVAIDSDGFGKAAELQLALVARRVAPAAPVASAAVPSAGPVPVEPAASARPDIVVYVIDCLRADHVGAFGYHRPTSPRIDAFAAGATVFLDAQAASSWTRPAVASIFTGLMPGEHGTQAPDDALAPEVDTLAEQLRAAGYQTAGIITNGNLASQFGIGQGFDTYLHLKEDPARSTYHVGADELGARAREWLDERDPARPFFLYLHATDPHGPYAPPQPFASRFAAGVEDPRLRTLDFLLDLGKAKLSNPEQYRQSLIDLYDAEVAFTDEQFGHLLDDLTQRRLLDDAIVVLVADHGEEFYDHGWWEHGKTLFREQLHVPLVIRFPGGLGAGVRVESPVHQVDILPTLLAAGGLRPSAPVVGIDLAALATAADSAAFDRPLRAELARDGRRIQALFSDRWKLITDLSGATGPEGRRARPMLFDRREDPREQDNLYLRRPVLAGFFRLQLEAALAAVTPAAKPTGAKIDEEMEANLRALGYIR